MGCHFTLQGIFPTQGSNLHLLHWQADSLPLSHLGSPFLQHSLINFQKIKSQIKPYKCFLLAQKIGLTHAQTNLFNIPFCCCCCFIFFCFVFGHAAQQMRSWFPDQGSNPHPLHWKHGVLTTGPPGKSPIFHFKIAFTFIKTIRNIGHQQTQEPGAISNMEQGFSYINYRKQGRELYKKTKSVFLLRSDISLYYTLNIFDISPMLFKKKQLN